MALDLSLSISQSNDATYLTVADATGLYDAVTNTGGWDSTKVTNEYFDDIVASTTTTLGKHHLTLQIDVKNKEGTTTSYTAINLYDLSVTDGTTTPYAATTDLSWTIDAADLSASGTPMGTSSEVLTDGTWTLTYTLADANTAVAIDTYTVNILVDGDVRIGVYDALREVPRQYDDEINDESREILESLLKYTYLVSLDAGATVSEIDDIITSLWTLDKMVSDGSKYTW